MGMDVSPQRSRRAPDHRRRRAATGTRRQTRKPRPNVRQVNRLLSRDLPFGGRLFETQTGVICKITANKRVTKEFGHYNGRKHALTKLKSAFKCDDISAAFAGQESYRGAGVKRDHRRSSPIAPSILIDPGLCAVRAN